MIVDLPTLTIQLRNDERGTIRVSGTRITLDVLLAAHQQGRTPESIHESFSVVPVSGIYAIIGYYLEHKAEVDAYLQEGEEEAKRIRQLVEANYTPEQKERNEKLKTMIAQKRQVQVD